MFMTFFVRCFHSFKRNVPASVMPLVLPLVFLMLFLEAGRGDDAVFEFRLGVVAHVQDAALTEALIETGLVDIKQVDQDDAPVQINARRYDGILATSPESGETTFYVRPGYESLAAAIINQSRTLQNAIGPVKVQVLESSSNGYLEFIIPGLFVMVLIQIATTSTANLVLSDRADGTLRIISTVKGSAFPLFSAELLFRLLFTLGSYLLMLAVAVNVAGFSLEGRWLEFTLVFALGSMMMITLGYTMGGLLPSRRNWSALITLIGLAFWFFSDILFQATQHELARPLALLLPPTYLTDALRQISTGDKGSFSLGFDVLMLALWLLVFSVVSVKFFRFETNDDRM